MRKCTNRAPNKIIMSSKILFNGILQKVLSLILVAYLLKWHLILLEIKYNIFCIGREDLNVYSMKFGSIFHQNVQIWEDSELLFEAYMALSIHKKSSRDQYNQCSYQNLFQVSNYCNSLIVHVYKDALSNIIKFIEVIRHHNRAKLFQFLRRIWRAANYSLALLKKLICL